MKRPQSYITFLEGKIEEYERFIEEYEQLIKIAQHQKEILIRLYQFSLGQKELDDES